MDTYCRPRQKKPTSAEPWPMGTIMSCTSPVLLDLVMTDNILQCGVTFCLVPTTMHWYGYLHSSAPCEPLSGTTGGHSSPPHIQETVNGVLLALEWCTDLQWPSCLSLFSTMPEDMGLAKMDQQWTHRQDHIFMDLMIKIDLFSDHLSSYGRYQKAMIFHQAQLIHQGLLGSLVFRRMFHVYLCPDSTNYVGWLLHKTSLAVPSSLHAVGLFTLSEQAATLMRGYVNPVRDLIPRHGYQTRTQANHNHTSKLLLIDLVTL